MGMEIISKQRKSGSISALKRGNNLLKFGRYSSSISSYLFPAQNNVALPLYFQGSCGQMYMYKNRCFLAWRWYIQTYYLSRRYSRCSLIASRPTLQQPKMAPKNIRIHYNPPKPGRFASREKNTNKMVQIQIFLYLRRSRNVQRTSYTRIEPLFREGPTVGFGRRREA